MPRKLILSEAFEGTTKEIVLTTRIPQSLYSLIEESAKEQGTSIATLARGLLSYHFLAQHLKSKLKRESKLAGNDLGLLENLRSSAQYLIRELDEIDSLRGQAQKADPILEQLVEEAVKKVVGPRFDEIWKKITKTGGRKK